MTSTIENVATVLLIRYGRVPEVARFLSEAECHPARGATVVVQTDRGLQLGVVLEQLNPLHDSATREQIEFNVVRIATGEDLASERQLNRECDDSFADWCARIAQWGLNLELVDLEWTLDHGKLILYVLCDRGPDSTKLALQAAASGFGVIEVQPVSAKGLVAIPKSSCGSGEGGCGCSH